MAVSIRGMEPCMNTAFISASKEWFTMTDVVFIRTKSSVERLKKNKKNCTRFCFYSGLSVFDVSVDRVV